MKVKHKSSKCIYMAINKLHKIYNDKFSSIFKTITFDNGTEFSRFKDIEQKVNSKTKRTTVYFAHQYASYERGTNKRHNRIIRKFIPKGKAMNDYSNEFIKFIMKTINNSIKKNLGYKSSESLFNQELELI